MSDPNDLEPLQSLLGYTFSNPQLLQLALTHPSCSFEARQKLPDNQRLEFLGDAILQMIITVHLFVQFPEMSEGDLTPLRASAVSRQALATIARSMNLGNFLRLGRGEEANSGRTRESNLADALEALIGALYLDSNLEKAGAIILPFFTSNLASLAENSGGSNPKGELQELLQGRGVGAPTYEVLEIQGPDHDRSFRIAVKSAETLLGVGEGKSKKAAEAAAAAEALAKLQK